MFVIEDPRNRSVHWAGEWVWGYIGRESGFGGALGRESGFGGAFKTSPPTLHSFLQKETKEIVISWWRLISRGEVT